MIHHYRRVKCPHCGKDLEFNHTIDTKDLSGSPLRKCPYCGVTYFDGAYKEPAITQFTELSKDTPMPFRAAFLTLIFGGSLYSVMFMSSENWSSSILGIIIFSIFAILTVICAFTFLIHLLKFIRRLRFPEQYMSAAKTKAINCLEGREGQISDELASSLARMENPLYLSALKKNGVDVPQYFYDRLENKKQAASQAYVADLNASGGVLSTTYSPNEYKSATKILEMNPEEQAAEASSHSISIEQLISNCENIICVFESEVSSFGYSSPEEYISSITSQVNVIDSKKHEPKGNNEILSTSIHKPSTSESQHKPAISPKKESASVHVSKGSEKEIIDALRQYADLLDKGIITQEEFAAKKKQLLKN